MDSFPPFLISFLAFVLLLSQKATADGTIFIGAIVDKSSHIGKEQKVAMEMAIEDVSAKSLNTNQSFDLLIKNSQREPLRAALAAKDLIDQQVQAILGLETWEEASLVAEVVNQAQIPVLSLADTTPQWASERWPFLLQASPNQNAQMKAIAAIVQSWEWHQVTIIYEDVDSFRSGVMPYLPDALQEVGAEIIHLLALPPFRSSSALSKQLESLKNGQCRVFVVHLSLQLGVRFFKRAKELNMMENDYVWITTHPLTSLVHSLSLNASTISTMQGILGVTSYCPQNDPQFQKFSARFRKKFSSEYPEEVDNRDPGIFAVQAYDAVLTVCLAAMRVSNNKQGGQHLLEEILLTDFNGLSGKVKFVEEKVAPAKTFQIINVVGRSYRELGFWSDGLLGFSAAIGERATNSSTSMERLGQVIWPGGFSTTPKGWTLPTNANPLRIGVPTTSTFKQYVNVSRDHSKNTICFEGFAIELFEETVKSLPYSLPYNFTPFDGTYDEIVEEVHLKKFDAVVGDVAIVSKRYEHAEFTQPYTESGLVMIVPVRSKTCNKAWLFMKPFTKAMWGLVGAITVYNGFVVWLIERNHCPELKGSALNQTGALLTLGFTTLFSSTGEKLHSNLSRMAMVVWLFVALVITQTYTANLTSILTIQRLEPAVADVESLRGSNAKVGYCKGSFVKKYLIEVFNLHDANIKRYNSPEEYALALRNQDIAAAFLEAPFAKLFLAKYCKEFIAAGPTYKVGGFGFVFPRGSPLLPDITKALLNVSETGKLRDLENSMVASQKCVDMDSIDGDISSLSPSSFWVLFVLTGAASTVALLVYVVCHKWNLQGSDFGQGTMWRIMLAVMRHWWLRKNMFSRRVSDVGSPTYTTNTSNSRTQV